MVTFVKICGITNHEDALVAAGAGADFLGFIFYPRSPRYIEPERAHEIIRITRRETPRIRFVGVFVNENVNAVGRILKECEVDLVQFHGAESPEVVSCFAPRCYKALRPQDIRQANIMSEIYGNSLKASVPAFIVDAFNPTLYGGSGERVDWGIARDIAQRFPIFLAGGLTVENIHEAIEQVKPWGVDVSSGVEQSPGLKDHSKLKQFIGRAKDPTGDFK